MTKPLEGLVCDLCDQTIVDVEKMDAEEFCNRRATAIDEIFVMVRCIGCRVHTVVCDGGDA